MGIFKTIVMKFVECKHIMLPLLFLIFFLHLFTSRPYIDTGVGPASFQKRSNDEPLLRMYHGPEFFEEPNHLDSIDVSELFPGRVKDINTIHLEGVMHKGTWILVSDVDDMVFVAKRSSDMKTCPNAWGFVGEHFALDESMKDNVKRCLEEELGSDIVPEIQSMDELFEKPLFYKKDYANNQGRKDRQITYGVVVKLGKSYKDISFHFANEIASQKWIPAKELQLWLMNDKGKQSDDREFCDEEMLELMTKMNDEYILQSTGTKQTNR